jgi:uncharacterized membrane protein YedE/YeeE
VRKGEAWATFFGVSLGFMLSHIGFSSWDEVNAMFRFQDLRMFLAFCTAVALLLGSWRVILRVVEGAKFRPRPIHKGTLAGGLMFGAGWALSGACPSIALVQLGEGQLAAIYTLAGILLGNWLYATLHARFLRWDTGTCVDD